MTETLANGYSSESTRQELSNEYQFDRVLEESSLSIGRLKLNINTSEIYSHLSVDLFFRLHALHTRAMHAMTGTITIMAKNALWPSSSAAIKK